jgi:hypothetical protein
MDILHRPRARRARPIRRVPPRAGHILHPQVDRGQLSSTRAIPRYREWKQGAPCKHLRSHELIAATDRPQAGAGTRPQTRAHAIPAARLRIFLRTTRDRR